MASDAFGKKSEAKNVISNAIWGFALAMGAWMILNTIDAGLTTINLSLDRQEVGPASEFNIGPLNYSCREEAIAMCTGEHGLESSEFTPCVNEHVTACLAETPTTGEEPTSGTVTGCTNCTSISSALAIKTDGNGACSNQQTNGCFVNSTLNTRLVSMTNTLENPPSPGIRLNMVITEAYPPTVTHQASCHYNGTCVDMNFIDRTQANQYQNIRRVIDAANSAGLRAVYEVNSETAAQAIRLATGLSNQQVIVVTAITGAHFSVYLQ